MNPRKMISTVAKSLRNPSPVIATLAVSLALCESSFAAGEVQSGQYRNLFAEAGHSQAEINAKIKDAYQKLFHGDPDSESVYYPAGRNQNGPLAYIIDIHDGDVRSEGMSYGMMISVQLNHKAEFNALWNWARTYMYHADPSSPSYEFFSWSMTTNGTPNDEMPAPDGEQYFAAALCFASARWGDTPGIYNYRAEADRLLSAMVHRAVITGPTVKGTITVGALFDPNSKLVRFTPDVQGSNHTDPSYHLPAFYQYWSLHGPAADRAFWAGAAQASRDFFHRAANPSTALASDYANFDGSPWSASWNPRSATFQYDSWRTAMNWSVDYAWWATDTREKERSDRLQTFFESEGMESYGNRFTLDGQQLGDDHSLGLVSMNAVASLAATGLRAQKFVEALWTASVPSGEYRYYDGMLYMLALSHCSGNFRAWAPNQ
jgi:oligosaccharide reducing-end xylanase